MRLTGLLANWAICAVPFKLREGAADTPPIRPLHYHGPKPQWTRNSSTGAPLRRMPFGALMAPVMTYPAATDLVRSHGSRVFDEHLQQVPPTDLHAWSAVREESKADWRAFRFSTRLHG